MKTSHYFLLIISINFMLINDLKCQENIKDFTSDFKKYEGFFNFYWDEKDGKVWLEIEKLDMSTADGRLVTPALSRTDALLPDEYTLDQNYPNPFNPETNISFGLPEAGEARLVVYNILGRKVRTLLDEYYPAGTHTVTWDATDDYGSTVASGVYFYRLETEATTLSHKMMLLK